MNTSKMIRNLPFPFCRKTNNIRNTVAKMTLSQLSSVLSLSSSSLSSSSLSSSSSISKNHYFSTSFNNHDKKHDTKKWNNNNNKSTIKNHSHHVQLQQQLDFSTNNITIMEEVESSSSSLIPSISILPITQFTEEEIIIQDTVRNFAKTDILPLVHQMENEQKINPIIIKKLFTNGFMGLEIQEEQYSGGSNMSFTGACIVIEELSKIDPSVALLVDIHNTLIINILRLWSSDEIQRQYLPKLATDTIGAFCLSEAQAGSDAFAMSTNAIVSDDGSYYTITGNKLWISNAREAGVFLVFANVDLSLGYKGITAFIVDADTDGISVGKPESKMGLKATSTCPVMFDNVKVDANKVVGQVGQGYKYCIDILNEGRIGIAAQQTGIAKGCLDIVMPYLFERKQFGQYIGDFQGMQHQYAQLLTEVHAAETMLYNACRLKENGMPFVKEASMVKLYSSQVAEKVSSKCIELLGGVGFTTDTLVEKFYRDVKVGSIYEGTSNMQLQTIAKIVKQEYTS